MKISHIRKFFETLKEQETPKQPVFEIKKLDPFEILENAHQQQERIKKLGLKEEHDFEINLKPGPDGFGRLVAIGDLHTGNRWSDYEMMGLVFQYCIDQEIGILLPGDLWEMFLNWMRNNKLPVLTQIIPPDEQFLFIINLFRVLIEAGLLKAVVYGNHDQRPFQATGIPTIDKFIDFGSVPFAYNRMIINVRCGEAEYPGFVGHKLPGHSMYHGLHDLLRAIREQYPWATWGISAHTHIPEAMDKSWQGRMIPLLKIGSFNAEADYAQTRYGNNSFISCPMLCFDSKGRLETPLYTRGFFLDKFIDINIKNLKKGEDK